MTDRSTRFEATAIGSGQADSLRALDDAHAPQRPAIIGREHSRGARFINGRTGGRRLAGERVAACAGSSDLPQPLARICLSERLIPPLPRCLHPPAPA